MKILIIGSKGFIGSHCVSYFKASHDIWQCDVVTDYVANNYFIIDSSNSDYNDLFQSQTFDVCINCSGAASVPDSLIHPHRDFTLNVINVFKQLDAIRTYNPDCKYIHLSSAAVYGNPKYLPIDENHPLLPISPYGVHKKIAETLCTSFYENYHLKTCSLRLFSAYGNGLQKQIFWDLHKKTKASEIISLFGTGLETRDFIHVNDITRAIDLIIQKCPFNNDIINVANGEELTIKYVADVFLKHYQAQVQTHFQGENRTGDPLHWRANIDLLRDLGFKGEMTIEDGLKLYVQWLKDNG